jgi:hypothetical protein
MASRIVTHVRKETVPAGHKHIAQVKVDGGVVYSRLQVVESITSGTTWITSAAGASAPVRVTDRCPHGCTIPYITTAPDGTKVDNLDNLPPF